MSLAGLQQMKREGKKIVAVVAWDYQIAQIADRAGVDLVSVGDSVGVNLWGRQEGEISLDEMLIVCKAVRRGVKRALLSCDLPEKENPDAAVRLLREGGADMVKLLASPETVRAVVRSGVPVFAEFHGDNATPENLVKQAKHLEQAGASLLDFRHSGPEAGAAVAKAVSIPVLGGLGGGPWLDGRIRMVHAAIGYAASNLNSEIENYANVAQVTLKAIAAYAEDVRAGRHLKGQRPA
ncbi:MAG: 3-methyl-2-oxobutanoate hydroxymethyltransferase [Betaproteobacteria bacterium]|nr:MAG: 3-methyl-2-oxobutanoate hydroxymethyltransferase [Betaproteobacteria bacterium]TMH98969.1 MAG: 3-methyl-2-oxobutanoate hydroxymethyltransferase [Betaproteobacteria bacterium]TMI05684.1 MAG: 3-methyl-2-oxobutanoate hydroxymethyltransferase [Betaproteobacteria bacterium]